ncbi:uncharacterized protein [Parasteatoda tepidariorum]|uniref:uncharacterized protein n=1 Tax=Parasteatoda tepidariorum TaxID=114398 RepID=UPI0039BCB9FB
MSHDFNTLRDRKFPLETKEQINQRWVLASNVIVDKSWHLLIQKPIMTNWEAQIENNGTRFEKLLKISTSVLDKFKSALDSSIVIHDVNIKKWALKARDEEHLSPHLFTASSNWLHNFKKSHRTVSRKINKFVTLKQLDSKYDLLIQSDEFVQKVKSEIDSRSEDSLYNYDQSGFNLQIHAGRTLAFKGVRTIQSIAQSLNSMTHSYTIQPTISASGKLQSPLFIVLQEKDGKFGPIVKKNFYQAENIAALASTSGKLSSYLSMKWFENVFLAEANKKSVLCLDSRSGRTEKQFEEVDTGDKNVKILKNSGKIQPLVVGFRPWKNFVKYFSDIVILHDYDVNLHLRNNVLKLQSLTHNQFSSPRCINLFKYAWYKSGYLAEKAPKFVTPVDFCFKNIDFNCSSCVKLAIIKCSWCKIVLCMNHFFNPQNKRTPHYCKNFEE